MNTALSYVGCLAGYNIYNTNNLFNFHFTSMTKLDEQERKDFIINMKLIIGQTYTNDFRVYIFKKLPDSILLQYF